MRIRVTNPCHVLGAMILGTLLPAAGETPTATPPAPPVGKDKLRVGAWNIENLGFKAARNQPPLPADQQKPEDLVTYIVSSGVDVLALEEIHDDDQRTDKDQGQAPWKNRILDAALPLLAQATGEEWQYELTGPGPDNVRCQMTGVLWKKSRVSLKGRKMLAVKGGEYPRNTEQAGDDQKPEAEKLTYWTRRPEAFHFSVAAQ